MSGPGRDEFRVGAWVSQEAANQWRPKDSAATKQDAEVRAREGGQSANERWAEQTADADGKYICHEADWNEQGGQIAKEVRRC